ncbi:hypothetical protein BKA70DRAFT_1536301 [Coprinopsis sp. MPI-PUGE-AT-0042]|nr:hypothetical protein BKA70DRAFT_1536301 [Coprinopsis sp. MPI-PUGE-AT-0042]
MSLTLAVSALLLLFAPLFCCTATEFSVEVRNLDVSPSFHPFSIQADPGDELEFILQVTVFYRLRGMGFALFSLKAGSLVSRFLAVDKQLAETLTLSLSLSTNEFTGHLRLNLLSAYNRSTLWFYVEKDPTIGGECAGRPFAINPSHHRAKWQRSLEVPPIPSTTSSGVSPPQPPAPWFDSQFQSLALKPHFPATEMEQTGGDKAQVPTLISEEVQSTSTMALTVELPYTTMVLTTAVIHPAQPHTPTMPTQTSLLFSGDRGSQTAIKPEETSSADEFSSSSHRPTTSLFGIRSAALAVAVCVISF